MVCLNDPPSPARLAPCRRRRRRRARQRVNTDRWDLSADEMRTSGGSSHISPRAWKVQHSIGHEGGSMFRALLRLVILLVVIVGAAAFFLGYWGSGRFRPADRPSTTGTSGHIDTSRARDAGAAVGEKAAEAANKAGELLTDGALTTKIKSKMALDDSVRARSIDVTTRDHVVTLSGTVRSVAEHDRAVQLAKETDGIRQVVDRLTVSSRLP